MLTRLMGILIASDSRRFEILRTYDDVGNFVLRACETDDVTAEALIDVISFRQSFAVTGETYDRMLRSTALPCRTLFSTDG